MSAAQRKGLNRNQLKLIAILAMTIDHLTWMLVPGYSTQWWALALHALGRITAPIMWFFIAEGYHYTRSAGKYLARLFLFALISHFAYNFAFGIPFLPFQTGIFNQTSVFWSLAWGLAALMVVNSPRIKPGIQSLLLALICLVSFCADWSCIGVLAIVSIGTNRGNFKKQMACMTLAVFWYALVYFFFLDRVYGILQLFVVLAIPLLRCYNGQRGEWNGMKWLFYLYYPLHLFLCGLLRLALHGNIGIMAGA